LTASTSGGVVSLAWTAPAMNGGYSITDYRIQYSSNSGSSWTTFSHSASSATSATVTGLTNGTAYIFQVAAVTVVGTGAYSTASSSVTPSAFTAIAVLLTSGTSYTVPSGATSMKAWAVGPGGVMDYSDGAGGTAYKTWTVSGGNTVSYAIGVSNNSNTTLSFSGTTITGFRGSGGPGGSYSGGDGGAIGGSGYVPNGSIRWGGAVGGNTATAYRYAMTDVSGLKAALALAGAKTVEDNSGAPAFGSGNYLAKFGANYGAAGLGGGSCYGGWTSSSGGGGAVVLYFT
jgi:titin